MSPMQMTVEQIKERGFAALMRELGPVGYVRFMQEVLGRKGNYTSDRAKRVEKLDFSDLDRQFGKKRRTKK